MFKWLKPAPAIERLPADMIDRVYKLLRIRVLMGISVGYAAYYLVRSNFTLSSTYLVEEYGFSTAEIGLLGSIMAIVYGFSKFFMGNLSDKAFAQRFIAVGLFLSGLVNICFGFASSFGMIVTLLVLNGIVQGMGAPPCSIVMTKWFSKKERGTKTGIWNISHNVGGMLVPPLVGIGVAIFGENHWQGGVFIFPAIIAMVISVLVWINAKDTPESEGLPPIDEYRNDYENLEKADNANKMSPKEILMKYVVKNKFVWFLCIANAFVYLIRFGVINWVPLYLTTVKGFSKNEAHAAYAIFEGMAIPSSLIVGLLSDKLFKGKRMPLCIISMVGVVIGTFVYWQATSILVVSIAVSIIGCLIYVPQFLIGLSAMELVPKFAVGTTVGMCGLFGYVGGSLVANAAIGVIVDRSGWDGCFILLLTGAILSTIFLFIVQRGHESKAPKAA
ncbi:MFS transporter [Bacillus cereus]|uniref:MFS transporter n=1 Tax=Bacillus cereus TaxID=1396 RepID=A0A9X6VM06_BACCE|nr:MFS transporter [Bacillus cereus]HDR6313522.1 MFS transporter [Bacillus thuringiensis]PFB28269.1 MFS transporter [Bacillus cereus]PFC15300.1 MFS transporter [Bacillus cereus]PFD22873.1 MFS transporter [Bacillus cereus]PFL63934.1 MFS transporter [Bacillus cereus]